MSEQWVITGKNKITGEREEISRPMSEDEAAQRLIREKASRKVQRFHPYSQLRIEKRLPVQLTIQFE